MNPRIVVSCGLVLAALLTAGCDEGRQPPGRTGVQIVNAAPGFAQLTLIRERDTRNAATVTFKGTQELAWDADTYDFTIGERSLDGVNGGRTWTFSSTLASTSTYEFVLTDVAGEVQPIVVTRPTPPASDAQMIAVHAGGALPAMDLYLERPGVGIAGAAPRGTLNPLDQTAPRPMPSGEYELFMTAAGNPANVLFSSSTVTLPAAATSTFVVVPEAGLGNAPFTVMLLQSVATTTLYDRNATAELRVLNGATDRAPRDVMINSQLPPLLPAVPFGQPSAYATTPVAEFKINVTPVGNPGVLELDQAFQGLVTTRATMLFAGPAGTLTPAFSGDDRRRIHNEAKLQYANAASQFTYLELVVTPPDADPSLYAALSVLASPSILAHTPYQIGEYDLYLRIYGEATIVAGPTRVNLAAEGIYGVLAVDGPDTSTAEIRLYDDFVP